jgi:Cys-rich repeat protein
MVCDMANGACVECLANSDCSGTTPVCDPAIMGANAHRCVVCLPPRLGGDAGVEGCDAGQMCLGGGAGGGFRCGP